MELVPCCPAKCNERHSCGLNGVLGIEPCGANCRHIFTRPLSLQCKSQTPTSEWAKGSWRQCHQCFACHQCRQVLLLELYCALQPTGMGHTQVWGKPYAYICGFRVPFQGGFMVEGILRGCPNQPPAPQRPYTCLSISCINIIRRLNDDLSKESRKGFDEEKAVARTTGRGTEPNSGPEAKGQPAEFDVQFQGGGAAAKPSFWPLSICVSTAQ
eukprot:1156748-Pelagomonas_calceolata.AAC.8